jgi:hypothetical protein
MKAEQLHLRVEPGHVFVLGEDAWQVFDQASSSPAAEVPGLRELLSTPTVLDEGAAEPPSAEAGT